MPFYLGQMQFNSEMIETNAAFSFADFLLLGQKEQGFTETITGRVMNGGTYSDGTVRMN